VAAGTTPFTYQWRKNGVAISGATNDTLSFAAAQLTDAGAYSVVVTNAGGTITSAAVTLTVVDPGLTISTYFPALGATGLPIDVPLKVTFSLAPTLGTAGTIRIVDTATSTAVDTIDLSAATQTKSIGGTTYNYYPVIITGNTALITPHVALAYNKTYAVRLDRGTFKTAVGVFDGINDDTTWRFSTKAAGPAAGATSLVVAADGTGDFATVQGVVDFVPSANTIRRFVLIKSGTYQELIRISNKPLITLHGEDRKATIIQYANNNNLNASTSTRPVLVAETADATLENLTVHNLTPKGGSQAEAVRTGGARAILRNLDLMSYQDTLLLNSGTAYVENAYIEGDVDFLWGSAAAYFTNCELRELSSSGYIVQARTPSGQHGFVFVDCLLTRASTQTGDFLARIDPGAYPYSEVVYVDNAMGPQIAPVGWKFDSAAATDNIRFCEHHSTDLIGDPLDVSQRIAGSCQLSDADAALYRDPAYVLGGWAPQTLPVIEVQPASQTVSVGQTAVLSVAATGRPAPTYQWQKDAVDVPGATSSALVLANAQLTDAGVYTVVVSNSAGSVTSAAATLTVVTDVDAPAIVTQPADQTVAVGSTATFSVTATGAPVLAYQWSRNGVPLAGATSASLVLSAVQISQAGFYSVAVSNAIGSVASTPALLSVRATPIPVAPTIETQPVDQTAIVGETVTFSVTASGIPTPTYQWSKDGSPITGATGTSLMLTNVQTTDSGVFSVVVTNPLGSVTSDDARLTILRRPQLIAFTGRGRDSFTGQHLTLRFVIQGATSKTVLIRVAGPALRAEGELAFLRDPKLILSGGGRVLASNDNWWTAAGDIAGATAAVGATPFAARSKDAALLMTLAPGTYVVDAGSGLGVARIEVYEVPTVDDTSRLVAATTGAYLLTRLFEVDGGFTIGGDTPGLVVVRALGPALARLGCRQYLADPRLTVYSGASVVASNDNWGSTADLETLKALFARVGAAALPAGSKDAALAVTLSPGTYRAHVSGPRLTSTGVVALEIYEVGGLAISAQPQSQTVNVGAAATFTVTASGAAPITYQWRKNGADIPGATSATLTLPDAQPTDAGVYSVLVSNPSDEILSSSATLTVTSPATQLPPIATFDLEGFATMAGGVTGGGLVDPADTVHYKIIDASTPSPAQTLKTYLEGADPLVIELRTDVDLGVLKNQGHAPLINPELIASGLGVIRPASNKTLFSANAATLRHGSFTISGASNIIVRNLRFKGLWEWDDATSGAYDLQSWDYFTIQTGSHNIWIDHCEFGKSYDGLIDIVHGSDMVTVSWSRFSGDLGTEVADQINYLESIYQATPADSRIAYYRLLRDGGQSVADIITHEIPQDKGSLVGNDDSLGAEDTGRLNVTFHHNAYVLVRQRTPRMRFGNAHVYNMFVDDAASVGLPGTQTAVNSTMNAAVLVENSYYLEVKTPYAFSGGGRVSDRGGLWQYGGVPLSFDPTRLNPVDPAALVWNPPLGFTWTDLTALPYAYTLDSADYTMSNPSRVGVIAPADALDEALLRSYLPMTSH
jgi:pectate lyase/pectin methylesterase-like acyl-CoA thioesterase